MKLEQIVESTNRDRSMTTDEALDLFIDRVRGMDTRSMQVILDDILAQGGVGLDVSEIKDPKVLIGMIGNAVEEFAYEDFMIDVVNDVLKTDEIHPPG